jgi:3-phenylpropionate/cinnamic acid dioxygenase small subunit
MSTETHVESARAGLCPAPADLAGVVLSEAMLLDQRAHDEWLTMFSADALYWMPVSPDATDPRDSLCHIHDDVPKMHDRVRRMTNGAHTEDPPARTARVLGVPLLRTSTDGDDMCLWSSFHIIVSRRGEQHTFGGALHHRLRREEDRIVIAEKCVRLIEAEDALPAMTVLF